MVYNTGFLRMSLFYVYFHLPLNLIVKAYLAQTLTHTNLYTFNIENRVGAGFPVTPMNFFSSICCPR